MMNWWDKNFASCELGDERLSNRAYAIGKKLSEGFGKALSEIFMHWLWVEKSLWVFGNRKTEFIKIIKPHCKMTSEAVEEQEVVLCIGDTTYLDYGKIKAKREG